EIGLHATKLVIGELSAFTNWEPSLRGIDLVVHTAGRAHILCEYTSNPLLEFRRINCHATLKLARDCVRAGVRRFIFISSIGVNGAETVGTPFRADDKATPHSLYAISKYEAEIGLMEIARETGLEVVVIRPPLIVGPNAPGNFRQLVKLLRRGIPLPLAAVRNQRSFVALDNLIDLIMKCLVHPSAANQTFLVSDGEDLSTPQLVQKLGLALGSPVKLFHVPVPLLSAGAALFGKREMLRQLCGSLCIDITKTRELLDWSPPITIDEGLIRAAKGFLEFQRQ
ncbi:MAG: NAD-dependent epimerase/dehydratase family protein, partial [Steroidobacter sp.]